ncbi:hypothetical protein J2W28_002922 [Variovorax boronicumulans]|nr:hypothetical protein [Variovorax boronicumulans]MDP9991745.1 hypothetical protein [Variovorax boronicumulans]MDQ0003773.1 hypothetical protein [Variovorax boronicumulans]MDQ0070285.1 hypothetical protein [Variovorax boronicumulans]
MLLQTVEAGFPPLVVNAGFGFGFGPIVNKLRASLTQSRMHHS